MKSKKLARRFPLAAISACLVSICGVFFVIHDVLGDISETKSHTTRALTKVVSTTTTEDDLILMKFLSRHKNPTGADWERLHASIDSLFEKSSSASASVGELVK